MGGFAFEIGQGGKRIPAESAGKHIAGYRPWVCVYHPVLLDELARRGHTIETWDRGISIFHGLWRQSCQALGDLIAISEYYELKAEASKIGFSGKQIEGDTPDNYRLKAPGIIEFMSQFMTVSSGDLWIKGPLVAEQLPKDVDRIRFSVGRISLEVMVSEWQA